MRRTRRGFRASLLALLLVFGLVAAACGGSDSSSEDEGDGGSTPATDQPSDIDPNGTIKVAYDLIATMRGGKFTLDPAATNTPLTDDALFYLLYGRLMRPSGKGDLVPDLAESATIVDGNTIEVKLRPDLTFSDGTEFNADTVKAGLERSLNSGNTVGFSKPFFDLKTITVVDPLTVELSIPGTAANWYDSYLGSWESTIVKPGTTDFEKPIGAGAMALSDYKPQTSLTLTKSDTYWDKDNVRYGGLELVGVTANDQQAAVNALAAKTVDMAPATVQLMPSLGSGNEAYVVENPNRLMTFQICKKDGPLANADVRKAISMAVDRETINEALYEDTYTIAQGLWPAGHRLHNPALDEEVVFDLEGAKQLLADAGYADGFTMDAYVLQTAGLPELIQVVQQSLEQIGIKVNINAATNYPDDFLLPQKAGIGVVPNIGSNRAKLDQWSGDGLGNACKYKDEEIDSLKAELLTVSDSTDEAVELWHQLEQKGIGDGMLNVPLLFAASVVGYNPSVVADPSVLTVSTQLYLPDPRITYVKAK
ncbi:MAG TPA: ABC transporter substrate-binding protein [Acidimicrobiales bacterium]